MTSQAPADLAARCQSIELLVADVNGVMTDGAVVLDDRGVETKHFHVRDGLAFGLWHRAGKQSAILSGRTAAAVERRASELGIAHVLQGHDQKVAPFRSLIDQLGLAERQVLFRGRRSAGLAGASVGRPGGMPRRCGRRGQKCGRLHHRHAGRAGRYPRSRRAHPQISREVERSDLRCFKSHRQARGRR